MKYSPEIITLTEWDLNQAVSKAVDAIDDAVGYIEEAMRLNDTFEEMLEGEVTEMHEQFEAVLSDLRKVSNSAEDLSR